MYLKSNFSTKENLQKFANMLTTYHRKTILTLNEESSINKNFENNFYRYNINFI